MKIRLLFILYFIGCIQSIQNIQSITIRNETIELDSITIPAYFRIKFDSEYIVPNYIKIKVQNDNEEEIIGDLNHTTFIISYYKDDSSFKERKQLSQSSSGMSIMFLNKEQITNEFYFSIEGSKASKNYSLNIFLEDTAELFLNEQYTYYVSEENKEMNFTVVNEISEIIGNNLITLWAKGNKNITSFLNTPIYIKHSKYNAYIFYLEEFKPFNINFTIYGEVGDIINVGALLFEGENDLISYTMFKNTEVEISGFLKRNFIDKICYKFEKINTFFNYASYVIYDNLDVFQESNQYNYDLENYDLKCIEFPENFQNDEMFFSIYYIPIDNNKNESQRINKFSPIQINGFNYKKYIKNGETIGIIPIFPEDDFSYLTYYVNNIKGKTKIAMYTCETYPFCDNNMNNIKNAEPVHKFYSYSFSYAKNELNDDFLSNLNPHKKIMLISCENKNKITTDEATEFDTCLIDANIYTVENKILLSKNFNYHKYIRKNSEDKFIIPYQDINGHIYINIEVFSGDILINVNYTFTLYEQNNKKLFIVENNFEDELEVSILAKNNSAYSINYYFQDFINMLMIGSNYLVSLSKNSDQNEGFLLVSNFDDNLENGANDFHFYGFYPLNCKIKVEYLLNAFEAISMDSKGEFYQDIFYKNNGKNNFGYKITQNDTNNIDTCLFYISIFKFNNESIFDNDGIILGNNISQLFAFDQNYSVLQYVYYYVEKDQNKNVYINLKLLDEEKYNLNLYINDLELEYNYSIIKDDKILIKSKDIKDKCKSEQQICKITFNLISRNTKNESIIEIKVNTEEENDDEDDKKESDDGEKKGSDDGKGGNKTKIILSIIIIIAFIFIIVIVVLILIKRKNKKDNLKNNIEEINSDEKNLLFNDKDN